MLAGLKAKHKHGYCYALPANDLHRFSSTSPAWCAATTHVQTATLLAASAIWHLLVVRSEALALSCSDDDRLAAPTAACLSKVRRWVQQLQEQQQQL